ncbi:ATP-binding protein [Dyella humi]|uniref:ATP-binding protein n=1 Tax=Dyella humi TaxID=1770547 RepID=A0ABW8IM48_9GAMM
MSPNKVAPGEGERRAQRGYGSQYESAAAAIYAALDRADLLWVGLADRSAGIADDVVLGFPDRIVAHQFKTSKYPDKFRVSTLLIGTNGLWQPLAEAWTALKQDNPGHVVNIHLVTNDFPANDDSLAESSGSHSAAFLIEWDQHRDRTLSEWRAGPWQVFIDKLLQASGLDEESFEEFFWGFKLIYGSSADFVQLHRLSTEGARLASEISKVLPKLVADPRDKDRWSREELLDALNWRDSSTTRHHHYFPIGAHVQRNAITEHALREAIHDVLSGYVALVGPPGAGKSTLLQTSLATEAGLLVVRYLAYVPGIGQGVGRGEADDFLDDVAAQLKDSGLLGLRYHNETLSERREHFAMLLKQAGQRYKKDKLRTLIVVDGLDHVPREERPERSLLAELPLPDAVPEGVLFVLGTQRLDLTDLKPAVRSQASAVGRQVDVAPLTREAVHRMADQLELDDTIARDQVFSLSHGHPLVTRYIIEALRNADENGRTEILAGSMKFEGDIEAVYESAWRGIESDPEASNVLGYLARAEGAVPLPLLATIVSEAAIERALTSTKHLLIKSSKGWSVFHNSFRLFILGKPHLRLGEIDPTYSIQVYRQLATLARTAPAATAQRWLELRYLARAGDDDDVLQLAQAKRFREQLAQGRRVSDIQSDIRLAYTAALKKHNPTTVVRLLLAEDEIGRRATTLEGATDLTEAFLAAGDIDTAQALAEEYGHYGYEIVDAFLARGAFSRARELFEKLEPLQQLLTGRMDAQRLRDNAPRLFGWARRAIHFRDLEFINKAIQRLANAAASASPLSQEEQETEGLELAHNLSYAAALAILESRDGVAIIATAERLRVPADRMLMLRAQAGLSAHGAGATKHALALLHSVIADTEFLDLPNAWRRQMAWIMVRAGEVTTAHTIFAGLVAPAMAMLDKEADEGAPEHLTQAIIEHTKLATVLARPIEEATLSEHAVLRALQVHAIVAGKLLGRLHAQGHGVAQGEVYHATQTALAFLSQSRAHSGDDFFALRRTVAAAPVLGRAFIEAAALRGDQEFRDVLGVFDRAFAAADPQSGIRLNLRRHVALAIYAATGNTTEASRRLEPLLAYQDDTPSAQVNGVAELAIAFAAVGNSQRAHELLKEVPAHTLGYALAPKKDPQYATWIELLARANGVDPLRRGERIALLMQQAHGMAQTEGSSAAHRMTHTLIVQAAMRDAGAGLTVAMALMDDGLIGWPNVVDAILLGIVKRSPGFTVPCAIAWMSLSLPFYAEPYYRESRSGEFLDEAMNLAPACDVPSLVETFQRAIETDSLFTLRGLLMEKLHSVALKRGHVTANLTVAMQRWTAEAPFERYTGTPGKYDEIEDFVALKATFEEEGLDQLNFEAPSAFTRLVRSTNFEVARDVFERAKVLQSDSRSRFLLVDMAIDAGDLDYARKIVSDYNVKDDRSATWAPWMGGGALRYFRARVRLEGPAAHTLAYEHFVGALAAGREFLMAVLMEIEDILPVLDPSPDWVSSWELLAEQLATTREHALGKPFSLDDTQATDEEVIARLFQLAAATPIAEVQRHAQLGATRLASTSSQQGIVARLVQLLLEGKEDEPVEALQILLRSSHNAVPDLLREQVHALVNHADFAVAEMATTLLRQWGTPASRTHSPLPAFYSLVLDDHDDRYEAPALADNESGAMRILDAEAWTAMFPTLVDALARGAITPTQIRLRCAMFIQQWGGLAAYGQAGTDRLQATLRRWKMKITYRRPHVMVALRALRHVAGELRSAGLLTERDVPFLRHLMGYPGFTASPITPVCRPPFMARPALDKKGWMDKEVGEQWLRDAEGDLRPLKSPSGHVLAEISQFWIRKARQAEYTLKRVRAPSLNLHNVENFEDAVGLLPKAIWLDKVTDLTNVASSTVVRRLSYSWAWDVPHYPLAICSHWLKRLHWSVHPDLLGTYVNRAGDVVAQFIWWRDGGPIDIDESVSWGEGVYVQMTPQGRTEMQSAIGMLNIVGVTTRTYKNVHDEAEVQAKTVMGSA